MAGAEPLGGAKGLVEKIQPLIKFPVLMRVVLPGVAATVLLVFLLPPEIRHSVPLPTRIEDISWRFVLLVAAPFLLGIVISALGDEVYKVYEGRIWPQPVFDLLTRWQQRRVDRLLAEADRARAQGRDVVLGEIWYQLRVYPVNAEGQPYATHPTRIGNILAGYEDYPYRRYKMDPVFYWPRIWLQIEKDKKEAIDAEWSIADGFLLLSAVGVVGGTVWLVVAAVLGAGVAALIGLALLGAGYLAYLISLPLHRRNGETFKAVFDIYRDSLEAMTIVGPSESAIWEGVWQYLQYGRVKCTGCGSVVVPSESKCPDCGFDLAIPLERLKREHRAHSRGDIAR